MNRDTPEFEDEYSRIKKMFNNIINKILVPPSKITIEEWSDKNRVLSKESASEHGDWDTKRTPYMIEIYKKITEKKVREVVLMMASQLAKTEFILNIMGRYIELDPCPMIIMQPSDIMAKNFSKERVAPMIRDTKVLNGLIKDPNKKNSGNTVTHKMFPGGFLAFIGANKADKLASRPARIIMCDEVDRYPKSSGDEGSPIDLIKKRTITFDDHKIIITGTPTVTGKSEVEEEYLNTSQGKYYLICPECGEYNELVFENLVWDGETTDDLKNVKMICTICGVPSVETEWKKDFILGKWIHKYPERKVKLGYHLNGLYGVFRSWENIVMEYLEIGDNKEKEKVFHNTVLALTFDDTSKEQLDYDLIMSRRESYSAELPEEVLILTCGIDTQDDRFAIEVVGHGLGGETWGIEYQTIKGNMEEKEIWEKLDEFLLKKYEFKDGNGLYIYSTCIDTGGHHTEAVYDFVNKRQTTRRIYGIKGQGGEAVPIINGFRRTKNNKIDLLSLGVNALKDITYSRLKIETPGPGYCHFNDDVFKNYDIEYFKELTSEIKEIKNKKVIWKQIRKRNEAFDCRNYATAALEIFKINLEDLAKMKKEERIELSVKGKLYTKVIKRKRGKGVEI